MKINQDAVNEMSEIIDKIRGIASAMAELGHGYEETQLLRASETVMDIKLTIELGLARQEQFTGYYDHAMFGVIPDPMASKD